MAKEKEEQEVTTEVTPVSEAPISEQAPTPKTRFRDRMREKYPEEKYDEYDDDKWDSLEQRYMDETDESLGKYKESEQVLNDLITSDEDLAMVMHEMIVKKKPFRAAIASFLSQDDLIPQPEDTDYEEYQKSYNERLERGKKRMEMMNEIDANEKATTETIHSFAQQRGLSDDEEAAFVDGINTLFNDLVMKRISPENVEMLYKALNYDKAVADAQAKGEIAGRNANIEAKKAKIEQKKAGDGLPNIGGSGEAPEAPEAPKPRRTIFDDLPDRDRF